MGKIQRNRLMTGIARISRFILVRYYWIGLFLINPCFAQISKVKTLQKEYKSAKSDTSRLRLLQQLTEAYSTVDPELKFEYATIYKQLGEKLDNDSAVADAYIHMGISYGIRSKLDSALYYFELAHKQSVKSKYLIGTGRSLADIAYAYDRLDNKLESIKYNFQALEIYKKIGYTRGINQCYVNIGSIYFDLKQYKLAESYFNQALNSYTRSKDQAGIGSVLYELGNIYLALNDATKALDYHQRGLTIREGMGDLNGSSLSRKGIATVLLHQKEYTGALTVLKKALAETRILKDKFLEGNVLRLMAEVYIAMKNFAQAAANANAALKIAQEVKSKIAESAALETLVIVYKNTGDINKAFAYQTNFLAVERSIQAEKTLKDITLAEFSRTRTENAELEKDNQLISSKNTDYVTRLNNYSTAISVTLVILISVSLMLMQLYRSNKEKQKANRMLLLQKEEIDAYNQELSMLNEVKNKFFSIISHDLRSPLNTLQSLFTIYREGDIEAHELGMLLGKMEGTILSTGTFLDNLLEWSKNQLDGMQVNPVRFNLSRLIAENVAMFETNAGLKSLTLKDADAEQVYAFADDNMINLVIRNLLSNSIKFCNPGDTISFYAAQQGTSVIMSIHDTGPGINEKTRNNLFNLDHALSTGTHGEKGNRLGLVLCKDMIVQNKGKIWFESNPGEGTTFWVELPAAKS
ncbi:tetratricopeptide repeat-containing sensor histidine kinase [Pedobacter duraquae]|uniref:histidine kinase n=1 Tax=Pedobacter duraquae TaxID=425511 RepID=A0A4R6IHX2_9SPHI|nr:tetratricopeptide repeat-containing sensor histidine kinase [Pedobacter duraquae]TDO21531.1 signal transduction histidine kinase [Pedobacter duraquae]